MIDNDPMITARDNIRFLVYLLGSELDQRIAAYRLGTPYEHVRASDIRVFVYASVGTASISEVARILGISRQAVHMSAQRLKELGVIELMPVQQGRRDLVMKLTAAGHDARKTADEQIARLESEISELLGHDGLHTFRRTLQVVTEHIRRKHSMVKGVADHLSNGHSPRFTPRG